MINPTSAEWRWIEQKLQERKEMLVKGMRSGNKQNQYEDLSTVWEHRGYLDAIDWMLKLPLRTEE